MTENIYAPAIEDALQELRPRIESGILTWRALREQLAAVYYAGYLQAIQDKRET